MCRRRILEKLIAFIEIINAECSDIHRQWEKSISKKVLMDLDIKHKFMTLLKGKKNRLKVLGILELSKVFLNLTPS